MRHLNATLDVRSTTRAQPVGPNFAHCTVGGTRRKAMTVREDDDYSTPARFSTICSCRHVRWSGGWLTQPGTRRAALCWRRLGARRRGVMDSVNEASSLPLPSPECNARASARASDRPLNRDSIQIQSTAYRKSREARCLSDCLHAYA